MTDHTTTRRAVLAGNGRRAARSMRCARCLDSRLIAAGGAGLGELPWPTVLADTGLELDLALGRVRPAACPECAPAEGADLPGFPSGFVSGYRARMDAERNASADGEREITLTEPGGALTGRRHRTRLPDSMIEDAIRAFPVARIRTMMAAVGSTWPGSDQPPTEREVRDQIRALAIDVRRLADECVGPELLMPCSVETGGLSVEFRPGVDGDAASLRARFIGAEAIGYADEAQAPTVARGRGRACPATGRR